MKRRDFIKRAGIAGAGLVLLPAGFKRLGLNATPASPGLSDPVLQPKFVNLVPDALAPGFKILTPKSNDRKLRVFAGPSVQQTGLVDTGGNLLNTPVWGYGKSSWNGGTPTWPGPTFETRSQKKIQVQWENNLYDQLLPVDTSLHWCYALHGYAQYTIADNGVPIVSHLHGGHSDFQFDGNPEFFFSPGYQIKGPRFVDKTYMYDNSQPAGNLWYHDHALGITRLNVYAGLAGFYFLRDNIDTGNTKNKLGLPAWPYEKAYAIQDRMFLETGELFYPAFPGDPFYDDFITGEGAILPEDIFPGGGPTALAEFFGDHMVVNGLIWPKEDVEPRNYRLHLLNGTDSRFMAVRFRAVPAGATDLSSASPPIPFYVIGSDQGLAGAATQTIMLLSEPGSRYDVVFNFNNFQGQRIIMENIGGDEPFGGDIPGPQAFSETDRIMAFDVANVPNVADNFNPVNINGAYIPSPAVSIRTRKVALFEGKDEFGRLQPLLGTAEPSTDYLGNPINWPNTADYINAGLVGQMEGAIAWHSPTTENPALGSTETWEVWNATGDAHPVHLHLVHFDIIGRKEIVWDSATNEEDRVLDPNGVTAPAPNGDGTYLVTQSIVQHNGDLGNGFRIVNPTTGADVPQPAGYVENAPKDMVTALPDQVAIIKTTFDKPGRYVWHCHILSHEDHEMMRVLHVGPDTLNMPGGKHLTTALPVTFKLAQNYPNPFNPTTTINFQLPKNEFVELKVYNQLGQEVRSLIKSNYEAGSHSVIWNGKNNLGQAVSSGVYIYRIKAGKFTKSMKMNLIR
jgi:FtsP/CotA-like multicopper oxidase with cupredoxin domain